MTVAAPPRPPETDAAPRRDLRPRRHPVRDAIAFVVAVALLVSATVFAFVSASSTDGATNPETAVRNLLEAISHNDAIGVVEALPPAERDAWRDGLPPIADDLQRLGILSPLSLSNVPGLTVEFRKIRYHTNKLWGEVGRVQLAAGELVITPTAEGFPIHERTRQLLDRDFAATVDPTSGARVIDLADWQPSIVAVKDGGGWHASLFYTLAETIRGGDTGPLPRFGQGPQALGAATPIAAVRDLIEASVNLDPTGAVTVIYPTEARALYDYSTLFLPEARRRAQGIATDEALSIQLQKLDLEATADGSIRQVRVVGADATLTDGDHRRRLVYRDGCLTETRRLLSAPDAVVESTTCDGSLAPPPTSVSAPAPSDLRLDKLTGWQGLGRAFPSFVVQERQGRWYVSPTRTVLTTLHEILQRLQPADVDRFSARLGDLWTLYGLPAPDH